MRVFLVLCLIALGGCGDDDSGGSCPGGVTTDGDCCTRGCACGASCISCGDTCRSAAPLTVPDGAVR